MCCVRVFRSFCVFFHLIQFTNSSSQCMSVHQNDKKSQTMVWRCKYVGTMNGYLEQSIVFIVIKSIKTHAQYIDGCFKLQNDMFNSLIDRSTSWTPLKKKQLTSTSTNSLQTAIMSGCCRIGQGNICEWEYVYQVNFDQKQNNLFSISSDVGNAELFFYGGMQHPHLVKPCNAHILERSMLMCWHTQCKWIHYYYQNDWIQWALVVDARKWCWGQFWMEYRSCK